MTSPSAIQDKAPKPPGLLPKNVQSWLLAGLAVLMMVIMWLTGGRKPPAPARSIPSAPAVQAPLEVNEAKIVELQDRIRQLQREQNVAQNALEHETRELATANQDPQPPPSSGANGNPAAERAEDSIREEQKKRGYLSLFASNVALSYRKPPETAPSRDREPASPPAADPAVRQLAELLKPLPIEGPVPSASRTAPGKDSAGEKGRKEDPQSPAAAPDRAPGAATGKTYVVFEGTVLESVLINRLDGQMAGPVECLVTNNVYSRDRQHLLIPAGSKVLGDTRKVENFGQNRLAVSFHRLLMPDGYSLSLDHFQGLNQIGDAGLRDQANNHYLRIFGASLAIGAIGAVAEGGTSGALTASGRDLLRQGFAQSAAQSSAQILDRFLNILPTVTIREGHRIKIYLSGDLALPDYLNHTVPSSL